jgi:hypothetical protein
MLHEPIFLGILIVLGPTNFRRNPNPECIETQSLIFTEWNEITRISGEGILYEKIELSFVRSVIPFSNV